LTEDDWNRAFVLQRDDGGLVRTRLGGKGDVTNTHVRWRYAKGLPYVTGPLLYDDVLYVIRDGGILATINPDTGDLLRQEWLKEAAGATTRLQWRATARYTLSVRTGRLALSGLGRVG
jgi:hypothetical protein